MDTTLIAAIAAAALVLGLFLLRKSSGKKSESATKTVDQESATATVAEPDETESDDSEPETDLAEVADAHKAEPADVADDELDEDLSLDFDEEEKEEEETAPAETSEEEPAAFEPSGDEEPATPAPDFSEQEDDGGEDVLLDLDVDEDLSEPDEDIAVPPEEEIAAPALPTLTIEIYETRLRERESEQQEALARAIANQDNITRDHVQIELVAVTDRIALLEDSYKEEMAWRQAALEALRDIAPDADDETLKTLQDELSSGETVQSEKLFQEVADQKGENAALAAFHGGRLAEARVDLYLALERYQQAVELDDSNSEYLKAAGVMARKLYRYRDARPLLEKLVKLLESQAPDSVELALARRELGYTYALSGALKQAGPLYKQAMKTIASKLGQDHLEMGVSWGQIAELQEAKGQYEQAEPTYSKALAILEKELGDEHPELDHILEKLAGLNGELEEDEKAAALYGRLCAIREKSLGATHPKLAMALQNLAEAYRLQGQYEAAEESYNKALAIMEANHGKEHPAVAAILQELAKLCFRQKKNDEGEALQKRATEIFEKSIQGQEDDITEDELNLQEKD